MGDNVSHKVIITALSLNRSVSNNVPSRSNNTACIGIDIDDDDEDDGKLVESKVDSLIYFVVVASVG
jgi:hypothetical protein